MLDIRHRGTGRKFFPVTQRKRFRVAGKQRTGAILTGRFNQGFIQPVRPGTCQLHQSFFNFCHIKIGFAAFVHLEHDIESRQGGLGKIGVELQILDIKIFVQDFLEALAQGGIVAIPWRIDQTGQEAAKLAMPHEQPQATSILDMQNPHRGFQQILGTGLEKLFAGKGFQNLHQPFAVMPVGIQT